MRQQRPLRFRRAFTLVELLVVIGIIALLISILLPVVNRARDQAVTVKCMANMRQIHMALSGYAAENRQSLPWGWIWERPAATGPSNAAGSQQTFTNWATTVSRYLAVKRPEGEVAGNYTQGKYYQAYSEVMRCPAVDDTYSQPVTYHALPTAMPDFFSEIIGWAPNGGPGVPQPRHLRPAKFSDLYNDNILLWDTTVWNGFKAENFGETMTQGGGPVFTYIDAGLLLYPQARDYRFRDKSVDPYDGIDAHLMQGNPIDIFSKQYYSNSNSDSVASGIEVGQAGAARFRHNRDRICNVVFTDGSVRSFTADFSRPKPGKAYNSPDYVETEWLRKYIMIKYPD